jgi:hypothetical protein
MIVRFLQDGYFADGEGDEIPKQPFDGNRTTLEGSLKNNRSV